MLEESLPKKAVLSRVVWAFSFSEWSPFFVFHMLKLLELEKVQNKKSLRPSHFSREREQNKTRKEKGDWSIENEHLTHKTEGTDQIHTSIPLQSHIRNPWKSRMHFLFVCMLLLSLVACLAADAEGGEMNASAIMHLAEQIDVHHVVVIMSQGRSGSTLLCNLVSSRDTQ
jgi:hypothetical protein